MAPEQILNRDIDGRADIYATGVMFFQMLVERLPLPRLKSTISLLKLKVKSKEGIFTKKPSAANPAIHPDMDEIILKATMKNPDDRFQDGNEFIQALEDFAQKHAN